MKHYSISRDPSNYQAWPDVALARSGKMICVFSECIHHGNRDWTRIVYRVSLNRGMDWSELLFLTEGVKRNETGWYWDCPRISTLPDGRLIIVCDRVVSEEPGAEQKIFCWISGDEGETWDGPLPTPISGIVPDRLIVSRIPGTDRQRWHIAVHQRQKSSRGELWAELIWYSDDEGVTWNGPITIAAVPWLLLCEGTVFQVPSGELVCMMRENSARGMDAFKCVSQDGGLTWSEPVEFPLPGCHRPVGGMLQSGNAMITFRFCQGGKGWLGWWTQNFCLAWTTVESCLAPVRRGAVTRIMPVAYDRSPFSDIGYSGWVQFPDGEIHIVYYLVDDHERGQIRGCSLTEEDIVLTR